LLVSYLRCSGTSQLPKSGVAFYLAIVVIWSSITYMFRLFTETTYSFWFFSFSPGYSDPALLFSVSTFLQIHSMQRRQQRKFKSDGILSNLEPLLLVIREELGLDWCFYKEFLNCVRKATLKGEDTSIWVHHIEPLVQRSTLQFAHQGVLFLFREMGAALRSKCK
jgi:hypothetical protein